LPPTVNFEGIIAIDVYLKIDEIKGESAESEHIGWIEITTAQWRVSQPKSSMATTAGGHTAERSEHRSISIAKLADLSSPLLMMSYSTGSILITAAPLIS
jgi:type VI secretion system secreted protein Hcp